MMRTAYPGRYAGTTSGDVPSLMGETGPPDERKEGLSVITYEELFLVLYFHCCPYQSAFIF